MHDRAPHAGAGAPRVSRGAERPARTGAPGHSAGRAVAGVPTLPTTSSSSRRRAIAPRRLPRPERGGCDAAAELLRGAAAADRRRRRRASRAAPRRACDDWRRRCGRRWCRRRWRWAWCASDSPHFIGHGGMIARRRGARRPSRRPTWSSRVGCRFSSWMWDERGPLRAPPSRADQHQHRSVRARRTRRCTRWRCRPMPRLALDDLLAALGDRRAARVDADWLPQPARGARRAMKPSSRRWRASTAR